MAFISKSKNDLVDLVSVLIKNEDDTCYLLLQNVENQFNLPWNRVYDGNWKEAAIKILSLIDLETPLAAIKLYKFWVPYNPNSSIFHAIFKVVLPNCARRRIKLNALQDNHKLKWILKKDLHKLRIKNKELLHALNVYPNLTSVIGSPCDIQLFEKIINRTDFLTEILEKDIILEANSSDDFYLNLIDCTNYTKDDQHRLYKEFMSNCFPNFYMNLANFRKFLEKFAINNIDAVSLFRAADVYERGELSFRDFLYIIIACDSTTQHSGSIAEIRSSYIFRYYAKKNINYLQPNEFGSILAAIHDAKNVKYDALSIAKEMELAAMSIGIVPGKPLDLAHFLIGVGELKIRGASILLRFKSSIRNFINIIDDHFNNAKCAIANFCKTGNLPKTYEIETNAVILKRNIPKYNIIDLGDKDHWMSGVALTAIRNLSMRNLSFKNPSITNLSMSDNKNEYVSRESKDSLSIDSICKEVLSHLKYFADNIPATATIGGKDSYSWATTNLNEFGVQLINVCNALKAIVGMESRLLALKEPVYIFGDLHGNFQELKRFEKSLFHYGFGLCPATSLFLGDYVDRGTMSVEVIAYLFASKTQNNESVYLLRGNHEMRDIQKKFTFYNECIQKFGDSLGEEVWNKINEVFETLPLAATINNTIFCCHGGIPPPWLCSRASDINNIPNYMPTPQEQTQQSELAWNLMWNDPITVANANPQIKYELMKKNGFAENTKRGTGHFFSEVAVLNFLKTNNYSYVVRAHEFQPAGIYFQFGGKLITVFSTSNYCGLQNDAACVFVDKRKIHVLNFEN